MESDSFLYCLQNKHLSFLLIWERPRQSFFFLFLYFLLNSNKKAERQRPFCSLSRAGHVAFPALFWKTQSHNHEVTHQLTLQCFFSHFLYTFLSSLKFVPDITFHRRVWVERNLNDHLVSCPLPWAGIPSLRPGCSKPFVWSLSISPFIIYSE